jgi:putative Mn2+ efflux pump MntP
MRVLETQMLFTDIVLIAIGLAMDAFAVSLAAGASGHANRLRPAVRLAFHLGLFQFMMPVVGWYLGSRTVALVAAFDHWIAFGLLAFVGTRMIWSGARPDPQSEKGVNPCKGLTMVAVCVATSIDAFAVGLSIAMVGVRIWYPSAVIGLITAGLALAGTRIGDRLGRRFGSLTEVLGGLLLICIGLRILAGR